MTKDNWHYEKSIQKAWDRKMKATCEAPSAETAKREPKGRARQGAAPAPALVAEIEAYSSTGTSGRGKSSRSGGDDKADEEEEEEAEQEEEDEDENSGTQAKGKRCTIRTVTEVHRAVPPAKKARTEKRRKKVKKYQNWSSASAHWRRGLDSLQPQL